MKICYIMKTLKRSRLACLLICSLFSSIGFAGQDDCYYEVGLVIKAGQLTLSLKSHMARKALNGLAESSKSFPQNIQQALLLVLHRELPQAKQNKICKTYHDLLPKSCPQNPRTVLFYQKNPKTEFSNSSKQAMTIITNHMEELLAKKIGIDFTGMAGKLESEAGVGTMLSLMDQYNSKAAMVLSLDGEIQQSVSSMWNALAEIRVSVKAFRIKDETLMQTGKLDLNPERIPVRKWDTSRSYREKHFGRAARKIIKKWSEEKLIEFMEYLR